jgi:hypothetical protein
MMKISKTDGTNDVLSVGGTLTYGGMLYVMNLSGTLAPGDSFKLFNASTYHGSFITTSLPALSTGMLWDTTTLTNGILRIVSRGVSVPRITSFSLSGTNLIFSGTNGAASASYKLLTSTNVALALSNWIPVVTNSFDGNGHFNFTNAITPNTPQQFYLLSQ